jgi:hypothetical protein
MRKFERAVRALNITVIQIKQERRQRHAASPLTLQRTSGRNLGPRPWGPTGVRGRPRGPDPDPPGVDYLLRRDVREVGRGRAERGVP